MARGGLVHKLALECRVPVAQGRVLAPPVTFLTRPNGTAKANLREMDGLLQDAWRPINRKYAAAPEPDPAEFLRRYGHHMHGVPMLASPLTGHGGHNPLAGGLGAPVRLWLPLGA